MNLIVDDGDTTRSNRKNILNPKFRLVGLASVSHKEFQNCTVLCYARHFFNKGEKIGELSDDNYEDKNKENTKETPIYEKINVARRQSVGKKVDPKQEIKETNEKFQNKKDTKLINDDDDMDLPEGVIKIERQEKIVTEGNVKKKICKIKKFKEDGTVEVEVTKQSI